MIDTLRAAAQVGDIDLLYKLIQVDPHLLQQLDLIPFVDTPLHIAASAGHTGFATEIMRLKPSFAWKLNQHGLSPMHLALQHERHNMVCRFVDINKELVRVKGREGLTPLHFVTQIGKIDLLAKFLSSCPVSIEDVTVRSETALHIAAKNKQLAALEVLVGWLQKSCHRRAHHQERCALNWQDEAGNTILHISTMENFPQAVRLLVDSNIDLNAKNLEGLTALDIVEDIYQTQFYRAEIKDILLRAGALRSSSLAVARVHLEDELRLKITFNQKIAICVTRFRRRISNDTRNALLVVAILFATSAYEATLNPPGGVYQANSPSPAPIMNTLSLQPTEDVTQEDAGEYAGHVAMKYQTFVWFWSFNTFAFYLSIMMICLLMPRGRISVVVTSPLSVFSICYMFSMLAISPSHRLTIVTVVLPFIHIALHCWGAYIYLRVAKKLNGRKAMKEDPSRFSGGNRW